jgi:proteic killer suppression protein
MIKSWKHKGLKNFYMLGDKSGIIFAHIKRLQVILQLLNAATKPEHLNVPSLDFHLLKGQLKNFYAVKVRANWRIIFQFDGEDATAVDYIDYH